MEGQTPDEGTAMPQVLFRRESQQLKCPKDRLAPRLQHTSLGPPEPVQPYRPSKILMFLCKQEDLW